MKPALRLRALVATALSLTACAPTSTSGPAKKPAPRDAPVLESFTVRGEHGRDGATVAVYAEFTGADALEAVLYLGKQELARTPLRRERSAAFDLDEPGDYRVAVEAAGRALGSRPVTARANPCAGGRRRLEAHLVQPPRVVRGKRSFVVELPRWNANDRDDAYVVEWLHEGEKRYEGRGRLGYFEDLADRVERARSRKDLDEVCGFTFGEEYPGPKPGQQLLELPGEWEVRIHREGRESVAARFTVRPKGLAASAPASELGGKSGGSVAYLKLETVATPKEIAALLARIPTACQKRCPSMAVREVAAPGQYAVETIGKPQPYDGGCMERVPPLPHVAHWRPAGSDTPHPLPFSREELHALVRAERAPAPRWAVNEALFLGRTTVDRPDFEHDPDQSPDANWHRRKAWEAGDFQGQLAEEAQRRALAVQQMPPYQATIREHGKAAWRDDEIPAPPEGAALDE
ncbi:MAG: hypothetical protein HY908_30205 [Myxococcales bacterium]|nr:hypothetical protein [Myxococcales bacterium]